MLCISLMVISVLYKIFELNKKLFRNLLIFKVLFVLLSSTK